MSAKPSIYYACSLPVRAGGELVNFQHVASLRKQGLRGFVLLDPASQVGVPSQPYSVPMVHWGGSFVFSEHDWLVVPEVVPADNFIELSKLPCQLVIHNQNPFYTFRGFSSVDRMNAFPLAGGLCCSLFTRNKLLEWGSKTDWQVVRPTVLPHFFKAGERMAKRRQIAYMPRKRQGDVALLKTIFHSLFPLYADIPWVEIHDMSRPQVAQVLAESLIFASLSKDEGLGLPPLEAMAAGCLVCGFDGGGGKEYADVRNGWWVPEGDWLSFSHALHAALSCTKEEITERIAAGRETAAEFNQTRFDAELASAWKFLLKDQADAYRLAPIATGKGL